MPFYRFEDLEANFLTPHLSTGKAPVIEGNYMYFCLIHKIAGTGSELHYHPNELLVFQTRGKADTVVGKDRRIIGPGMFVHVPAYARHSIKATEDGNCQYLYVKDKTWTVVGLAENEAVPEKAMTVDEVNRKYRAGELNERKAEADKSGIVIEGLHTCFYPIIDSLDAPRCSGQRESRVVGERLTFGFFEVPKADDAPPAAEGHEMFVYVLAGTLRCQVDGQIAVRPGDSGGPLYSASASGGAIAKGINNYTYTNDRTIVGFQDFGTATRDYGIWIAV